MINFNSFKSKVKTCDQCGSLSLGVNNTCMNCGADLDNINTKNSDTLKKPSETTIEVKAEEIKWWSLDTTYRRFSQSQFV